MLNKRLPAVIIAVCLLIAVTGAGLIAYSLTLPQYSDAARAREILSRACHIDVPRDQKDECTARWHRDLHAVHTDKWVFFDTGRGLLTFSASILAGLLFFRWQGARRWQDLRTPASKLGFLATGAIIWAGQFPAIFFDIVEEHARGLIPWWADSMGIPLYGLIDTMMVTTPVMVIVGWLTVLWKARLPVSLWQWRSDRPWRSGIWTAFYGSISAIILLYLYAAATSGLFLMVPLLLTGLYLTLSARAAVLSREGRNGRHRPHPASPG